MDKSRLFFGLLALFTYVMNACAMRTYEGYSVIRAHTGNKDHVTFLHDLSENVEIDFWREARRVGDSADLMVPPHKTGETREMLEKRGIQVHIIHNNVEELIAPEMDRLTEKKLRQIKGVALDYNDFNTFENILADMDDMASRCPTGFTCETYVIGQSWEGRDQKMLRIFKQGQDRPIHWMDTVIHAREWLGLAFNLKFADFLLSNYDTDEDAKMFLDAGDWYFLFVHNPDGYVYTWESERLWRKNRYNNTLSRPDTDCIGVDMNRNYMFRWGNTGSSSNPCSTTYRGNSAASEVEVRNVQDEILRHKGKIRMLMSTHTAANLILNPFGSVVNPGKPSSELICEHLPEPEKSEMESVSQRMAKAIQDTFGHTEWIGGSVCEAIYPASGGTLDFAKVFADATFSFTPELRDRNSSGFTYGFVAPASEIQPAFEETLNGMIEMMVAMKEIEVSRALNGASDLINARVHVGQNLILLLFLVAVKHF